MNPKPEPKPLEHDQIGFAIRQVSKWLRILQDNEKGCPTSADADHSALLNRLLSGKKEFPKPPPLFFSYPAYSLEEGEAVVVLSVTNHPAIGFCINQGRGWKPKTTLNENNTGIVIYEPTGDIYRLFMGEYEAKTLQIDGTRIIQKHPSLMIQKICVE